MSMLIERRINCFISCLHEDLKVAEEIIEYLKYEQIEAVTWADIFHIGVTVSESLQNVIAKSDFIIFIVPSNDISLGRENLFFELGTIVGMGKPLLVLAPINSHRILPLDLSSIMYLTYDPQNIESSLMNIRNWAVHLLKNPIH